MRAQRTGEGAGIQRSYVRMVFAPEFALFAEAVAGERHLLSLNRQEGPFVALPWRATLPGDNDDGR